MAKINVAVDGTAGSGKSFLFKMVADKLGYKLVDTGLIYRAFTYYCYLQKIDFHNVDQILECLKTFNFEMNDNHVFVNDIDVTNKLTGHEVLDNINYVTVIGEVREKIVKIERAIGDKPGVIELGRDITSVVLPDAKLKIYLDSPLEIRAQRRLEQDQANGIKETYQEVYDSIAKRDAIDKGREIGALKIVDGAWYIDSSKYATPEECVDAIVDKIKQLEVANA